MTDKKYVVPDGMMDAASRHCDSLTLLHASLEAAIRWLAENPIMPTMDQLNEMFKKIDTGNGGTYIPSYLQEWQRMMFLSPEPNTSEVAARVEQLEAALREMLAHDGGKDSEDFDARKFLDARKSARAAITPVKESE